MNRILDAMTRRDFLRFAGTGVAAGAAVMALPSWTFSKNQLRDKPNVLFIAIDDLNDWVGCLGGHPDVKTPNLDRLAARGVLFTNAHCPAPLCNASRAALMTGVRPSTSGVYLNSQPMRRSEVLRSAVTLPQHFMAAGYKAIGGGKIFHGGFPDPQSWEQYFPSKTKTKPDDPMPPNTPLNGIPNARHFDWGPVDVDDDEMGDAKVAEWATQQLRKKHDRPLFLGVGFFRPHLPWYVPRKYFEMYPPEEVTLPNVNPNDLDDIPEVGRKIANPEQDHKRVIEHKQWRKAVSAYLACISFTDAMVGRVIDALDNSLYAENTIVVLWSDHGWHLGEKLHWRKFALWEEATHNPMMIVAPGITKPNQKCARPVNLIDMYPTLIDLCDVAPHEGLEGISLLPLLKNPTAKWQRPSLTTFRWNNHSVRSERWRYIRYHDGSEELYDHDTDEMEWNNLARDSKYEHIKEELARWLPKVNAPDSPKGNSRARKTATKTSQGTS
jgi:choline-sulfatase